MSEFLRLVARAFVKNEGSACINVAEPFGKTVFVFPNRRSMKFFQKYLGEEYGKVYCKPLFSPQMFTISELFNELSGLQPVDSIEAQYILYRNYISLKYCSQPVGNIIDTAVLEQFMAQESFDEFIHWGNAIIADFNDIDKYLIDAKQLFTNIKDLKELDSDYSFLSETQRKAVEQFWRNFLKGGDNFKKENFSALWSIMYDLYLNFREVLRERGLGYEGMIYRKVAEDVMRGGAVKENDSLLNSERYAKFVFIGFNAPNKCEKALMRWLKESGKGDFYWDFYGPMVTDSQNKASMFISDAVKEFPSRYEIGQLNEAMPQFNVIGVPSGVGQAFVVANILKGIDTKDAFKTSVVLPDETLLMPVLNSIPEQFEKVNVTMGFPINATPLVNFMNSVAQLQREVKERRGVECFYHACVTELLKHEYIRDTVPQESEDLLKEIVKHNYVFIDLSNDLLVKCEHPLLRSIFKIPQNSAELLDYLTAILKELDLCADTLNKEFIYRYYLCLDRLSKLNIPMKRETCFRLISQIASSITIPFKGEPLAGLQVIGSLETRALDFDNVIILSVNEGRFPASSQQNSLVPYNLRVGFGLPTYEVMDAIAAYHFYRSIYRAKNVWLLYDTRSEGVRNGESSRYVKQLKYHYNINVNEKVVGLSAITSNDNIEPEIVKTPQIMEKLFQKYTGNNAQCLSASSLDIYIKCPMRFYLEKVEGLKEEDSVSEELDGGAFGTLFHSVMENIYKKYKGEEICKEIIDKEMNDRMGIDSLIDKGFKELGVREIVGQNLIVREVVKKYVLLTLKKDKEQEHMPFLYVASEGKYYHRMQVNDTMNVKLMAKIDRIDRIGNSLRIVDYKTTSKKPMSKINSDVSLMFDGAYTDRGKYWIDEIFQLYLYAYVIANNPDKILLKNGLPVNFAARENKEDCNISKPSLDMVIYPITKIVEKDAIKCETIYVEKLREFETALKECIAEIFNKEVPFTAAKNEKSCEYCMFKSFCAR